MSEYNDGRRQTEMAAVAPSSSPVPLNLPSPVSVSSSRNNHQGRGTTYAGKTQPTTEPVIPHKFPSNSDSTITNKSNLYSYMHKMSMQKPAVNTIHTEGGIPKCTMAALETSSEASLTQLAFRKFETYINETRAEQIVSPLQEMICGYGEGLARLAQSTHHHLQLPPLQIQQNQSQSQQRPHQQGKYLEPIALRRHIHSTPQISRTPISELSAIHDENGYNTDSDGGSDEDDPPPVGLDILDSARSRSTPLTTSENSAFGTILRTHSHRVHDESSRDQARDGLGSAFSLAPYAMIKATSRSHSAERVARPVIFNPIVHEDEILKVVAGEDVIGEMTSIEVTNVPYIKEEEEEAPKPPTKKKSAAARAARFLTDVRNLRISSVSGAKRENAGGRFRPRDGRENPAQPPSISSDDQSRSSSEPSPPPKPTASTDSKGLVLPGVDSTSSAAVNTASSEGKTSSSDGTEHADTDLSPRKDRVCIQVNENVDIGNRLSYALSSPEPNTQPFGLHVHDSPDSARFPPSISNSSGRVSQVTSASNSSNSRSHGSQLSAISETDREVAHVNILQRDRRLHVVGEQIELSLCSDRSIRSRDLNCSLSTTTPESRIRGDGASVRADRFFNYSREMGRFRNLPPFMKRSSSVKSPTAGSSSASVYSSSSVSSDEPPKIVSTYMDRKQVSDLSSLHYRQFDVERSSPRADHDQELREASPSEKMQAEYPEIIFEGAHAGRIEIYNKPRPQIPSKGTTAALGRKNRSLPPRSPLFSSNSPTPRGDSPACAVSPPRQIVGDRFDPTSTHLPKLQIMAPTSSPLNSPPATELLHAPGSHDVVRLSPNCDYYNLKPAARGLSPVYGHQVARTYEESSIEILKTDSKDDNSVPLVTPDKGTQSS